MTKGFNLGDSLAEALKKAGVSESDTGGREQIEYIDLTLIDADANNFYSLDGIDALTANIELIGLQQPLRVRENRNFPGRYILVSGHRRRAALLALAAEGQEQFQKAPCIVETPAGSEALQELRLIYANSDTRKMSSADLSRQAERVEALLYQLKAEGYEFPGRMRDHVAEACKVSATKLATLKVIREKLQEPFSGQFEREELSVQAAYAIARLPKEVQQDVAEVAPGKRTITGVAAENALQLYQSYYTNARQKCRTGDICGNEKGFLKATVRSQYPWQRCDKKCCFDCYDRLNCPGACNEAKKRIREEKEEQKKADEARLKSQEKAYIKNREITNLNARRILRALDACETPPKNLAFAPYTKRTIKQIEAFSTPEGVEDKTFYSPECQFSSCECVIEAAKKLHCSADYLLGLSDELTNALAWRDGSESPKERCTAVCVFDVGNSMENTILCRWVDGWHFFLNSSPGGFGAPIDEPCKRWFPLPEVKDNEEKRKE